jgi:hypothetical protein
MAEQRKAEWGKALLAFLIAVFLFSFGIFIGYLAKGIVESSTLSLADSARNEIINLETISMMEEQYPCSEYSLDLVSEKLDYLGELITLLEVKRGKDDNEVLQLKEIYTLLEIRHYLLIKSREESCGQNYSDFFFFYSNEKECDDAVKDTSFILSYLRKKYDDVRVYSFDSNLDSDVIKILKERYEVDSCVAVVLNGEKLKGEFNNSEDYEELIK